MVDVKNKIKSSTSKLTKGAEDNVNDSEKSESSPRLNRAGSLFKGADNDVSDDSVDFSLLADVVDRAEESKGLVDKLKDNLFWMFSVLFSISIVIISFWDALVKRGQPTIYAGIGVMLPVVVGVAFFVQKKEREKSIDFPEWIDVNGSRKMYYRMLKNNNDERVIVPFTVNDKGEPVFPDNPFSDSGHLTVAIDKDCIEDVGRRKLITVSMGKMKIERGSNATFRVELDPKYIPSSEAVVENYKKKMLKVQLDGVKHMRNTHRRMSRQIADVDVGEFIKFILKYYRKMIPAAEIMTQRQTEENVTQAEVFKELIRSGVIESDSVNSGFQGLTGEINNRN